MGQTFDSLRTTQEGKMARGNPMQMLQTLKNDPLGFLQGMGYNVPQGVDFRNPQAIIGALMQSGQVSRDAYRQGMGMMAEFPGKK